MRADVDVAIAGGGIAGCAAALTLLRYTGLSVAVFERRAYDEPRAGEQFAAESRPMLQYLGVDGDALLDGHAGGDSPACAWQTAELLVPRHRLGTAERAWFVDRARLDRAMADEARRRGARFRCAFVQTARFDPAERSWSVIADDGGEPLRARGLIDAAGSAAPIARALGAVFVTDDDLYAVTARYRDGAPALRHLIVEAAAEGWWYAVPIPGDVLVVTFITDLATMRRLQPAHLARWDELVAETLHVRALVDGRAPASLRGVFVPSRRLSRAGGRGWAAAGDAAMATDPISAMGIGFALHSGASAARALVADLGGDATATVAYCDRVATAFERYRATRRELYTAVARWADRPFWLGRASMVRAERATAGRSTIARTAGDGAACSSRANAFS
ncbi:MAG TPA: tryptophan 7-halogenase [Candidatus Elarobacter sp.]|nr:tryptophan 7-halogenase [Candidatus Elarobacter sp.]